MNTALFHGEIVNTSRIIYTASDFAKQTLIHIQEIGTLQATKPHTSRRENLSSYLFFMVTSGAGQLRYNESLFELGAGDCVFIDCRLPYSHSTSDDLWSISWIHFDGPTVSLIYQKYLERGGMPVFKGDNLDSYANVFHELYNTASSQSYIRDMEINTKLSALLSLLMSDSWNPEKARVCKKQSTISEIRHYLDENYSKKITLEDLSQRYYINKYYMTRIFKEQFGINIMDYLLNVRITEAKNLLRFTKLSAEEVGNQCGIGDIYYFSRVFKKIEGITIREYRKQWM